jgi:signal transduction histidine kinase/ligand-binding sensor domain-containing protein
MKEMPLSLIAQCGRAKCVRAVGLWLAIAAGPLLALNPKHQITQYLHRIWQAQPGLSQTSIYSLTQTSDGYLWLGTQNGVVRFDGIRFSPVPALQQASLGDIWARVIEQDSTGRVWITTTDFSLIRVDPDGAKVLTESDGLPTKEFSCLVPGTNGELWACGANALVRFRGDRFDVYPFPSPWKNRAVSGCRGSDGRIWVGGGSSLSFWNGSVFSSVPLHSVGGDSLVRSILCTGDEVWVGTNQGLIHLKDGREEFYSTESGLADRVILSLAKAQDGSIWVGTRDGFSRLKNGRMESYGYRDGLSQNTVFALREDHEGSLWVATKNGLNQFLDAASARYTKRQGLPSENMGPLMEDRHGTLWVGTLDAGLARFDGTRFSRVPTLASGRVSTLAEVNGALWVGTDQGLKRLEDGKVRSSYGVDEGLPSAEIQVLFRDRGGDLWVGTHKGPAVLREGRFFSPPALVKILGASISAMGQTPDGTLLFAVEHDSLYRFKDNVLREIEDGSAQLTPPRLSPRFEGINAIYTDPDGVVWMGTNGGGLAIWRNGKLSRFYVRNGLFDSEIYGFVAESADRLWMACSNGFFAVNRSDVFKFADGKVPKITSVPYVPMDGLRTVQGTPDVQPVGARTKDGRLWFSSSVWLLSLAPGFGFRNVPPPVNVESMMVNGTSVSMDRRSTLTPDQNNVAFQYTALSLLLPQRLTFRYLLEGYDKKWNDAGGRREAFYTNLGPGKFRFRVAACGAFVPCGEVSSPIEFEIRPHIYQRWWFVPLCVLALGLLAWTIYRMRVRQMREQFVLILAERSRIARELHDTLIQGFSGITMQLQAFAGRSRSPEDRRALREIIQDAGTCLQETRRSVAGLRGGGSSTSGLAAAISDAARQLAQEHGLRVKLNLDDHHQQLPAEVKYNLLCIVQESITNTIKHAAAHLVEITMVFSGDELRLTIHDDGRGLQRELTSNNDGGHYGMIGMRERAAQMGASLEITGPPGLGTTVMVRLPLTQETPAGTPNARVEAIP